MRLVEGVGVNDSNAFQGAGKFGSLTSRRNFDEDTRLGAVTSWTSHIDVDSTAVEEHSRKMRNSMPYTIREHLWSERVLVRQFVLNRQLVGLYQGENRSDWKTDSEILDPLPH
jgi:hypothetical protein